MYVLQQEKDIVRPMCLPKITSCWPAVARCVLPKTWIRKRPGIRV
ncbi:MAG: hypothetical protein EOM35_09630 [Negativicutes bacterium]|nr:hypothetical protein [Negativicutes bacterium]